jgi:hypothetical protein
MARTATRVTAAVGATVVMMALAAPALACTTADGGLTTVAASATQAKNDPATSVMGAKHRSPFTLAKLQAVLDAKIADKLAWLDKIEAKVSASDRLSDAQKADFLAHLQAKADALTQLRADIAAATTVDAVKAALKAADPGLFGFGHHDNNFGNRHHDGRFGDRHHSGFGNNRGDNNRGDNNRGDNNRGDHRGGFDHRGGSDNRGGSDHRDGSDNRSGGSSHDGGNHH